MTKFKVRIEEICDDGDTEMNHQSVEISSSDLILCLQEAIERMQFPRISHLVANLVYTLLIDEWEESSIDSDTFDGHYTAIDQIMKAAEFIRDGWSNLDKETEDE